MDYLKAGNTALLRPNPHYLLRSIKRAAKKIENLGEIFTGIIICPHYCTVSKGKFSFQTWIIFMTQNQKTNLFQLSKPSCVTKFSKNKWLPPSTSLDIGPWLEKRLCQALCRPWSSLASFNQVISKNSPYLKLASYTQCLNPARDRATYQQDRTSTDPALTENRYNSMCPSSWQFVECVIHIVSDAIDDALICLETVGWMENFLFHWWSKRNYLFKAYNSFHLISNIFH